MSARLVYPRQLVTDAVIDMLVRGTSKAVGDHQAPERPDGMVDSDFYPYSIVYNIPGGSSDGGLGFGFEETDIIYQVTSVGLTRGQADWMADRCRLVWLARTSDGGFSVPIVSPDGWTVSGRMPEYGFSGGVDVEGEPPFQVFSAPERYILHVTPVF